MTVHNHGTEDGPGLSCPETLVGGKLRGKCMPDLRSELVKLAREFDAAEGGTLAYTVSDGRFAMRKNAHDQLMYIVDDYLGGTS